MPGACISISLPLKLHLSADVHAPCSYVFTLLTLSTFLLRLPLLECFDVCLRLHVFTSVSVCAYVTTKSHVWPLLLRSIVLIQRVQIAQGCSGIKPNARCFGSNPWLSNVCMCTNERALLMLHVYTITLKRLRALDLCCSRLHVPGLGDGWFARIS